MLCGGACPVREATEEVQQLCDLVRSNLESQAGKQFSEFKATHYSSQVVAGTNYFIKISVGSGEFVHVRIFRPLPCNGTDPELHKFEVGKSHEDKIGYF